MSLKPPIATRDDYKSYKDALADGYKWEIHYASSCFAPFVHYYATHLQAALWLINVLVRVQNVTDTAIAELYRTDPTKYPAFAIDYTRDLSCFSDELTDAAFLHMYKDGEVYEL